MVTNFKCYPISPQVILASTLEHVLYIGSNMSAHVLFFFFK